MKKYLYTLCTVALLGLVTSCVDSFDTTNRNPDKLYLDDIDIQKIFPGSIYKSLNVLSEMNYNHYGYMARYVVSWTAPKSIDCDGKCGCRRCIGAADIGAGGVQHIYLRRYRFRQDDNAECTQ